jgi:hypothetical protein
VVRLLEPRASSTAYPSSDPHHGFPGRLLQSPQPRPGLSLLAMFLFGQTRLGWGCHGGWPGKPHLDA